MLLLQHAGALSPKLTVLGLCCVPRAATTRRDQQWNATQAAALKASTEGSQSMSLLKCQGWAPFIACSSILAGTAASL